MYKFVSNSFVSGIILMFFFMHLPGSVYCQNVTPFKGGLNTAGKVYAITRDSQNNRIFIGGEFESVNGVFAQNIAMLEKGTWKPLGAGINGSVLDMKWINGILYVGGNFTLSGNPNIHNIARWNEQGWQPLGNGNEIDGIVSSVQWFDNQIFICGDYLNYSTSGGRYLSRWDGNAWYAAGWTAQYTPYGLLSQHDTLWAWGGLYVYPPVRFLHNNQWKTLPAIPNVQSVNSLVINKGIPTVSTYPDSKIYTFSGGTWENILSTPMSFHIPELATVEDALYILYDSLNFVNLVRKISNNQLGPVLGRIGASGYSGLVFGAEVDKSLWVFGSFNKLNDLSCGSMAQFSENQWKTPDYCLARGNNNASEGWTLLRDTNNIGFYVGGQFFSAGMQKHLNIAYFDGQQWLSLGDGLNDVVKQMVWYKGRLYACGNFTRSGNKPLHHIACWDGTDWNACGIPNDTVNGLLVKDGFLFACGAFTEINGVQARIAYFDGTSWAAYQNMPPLPTTDVFYDLVTFNNQLNVSSANKGIWAFNGSFWYKVPNSVIGNFIRLKIVNGQLFATAKGKGVYQKSGTNWIDIGPSLSVNSLGEFQGNLLATVNNSETKIYQNGTWNSFIELPLKDMLPYDSTHYLITGDFPFKNIRNQNISYRSLALVDFGPPTANILTSKDTICVHENVNFSFNSNGLNLKFKWYAPGGDPETYLHPSFPVTYDSVGTYQVSIVLSNWGGSDTISLAHPIVVVDCTSSSYQAHEQSKILLYPNPVSDELNIRIINQNKGDVIITDVAGRLVFRASNYALNTPLNVSSLPPGFYFLQVENAGIRYTGRFVKE